MVWASVFPFSRPTERGCSTQRLAIRASLSEAMSACCWTRRQQFQPHRSRRRDAHPVALEVPLKVSNECHRYIVLVVWIWGKMNTHGSSKLEKLHCERSDRAVTGRDRRLLEWAVFYRLNSSECATLIAGRRYVWGKQRMIIERDVSKVWIMSVRWVTNCGRCFPQSVHRWRCVSVSRRSVFHTLE